jgi:hypothetical protein
MAEKFSEAMRTPPPFSNAEEPGADRLGRYGEAGELASDQEATDRVGQESGSSTAAAGPQPAGADSEVIFAGGPGGGLGGPHATDTPDTNDPGLPGHDQPAEGGRDEAEDGGTDGSFVDRLGR